MELTDFHFHDLRHRGATQARKEGFSGPVVQAPAGWKTEKWKTEKNDAAATDKTVHAAAEAPSGNAP